ncbi:transcriptional regulator [Zymobacter palmae]|uniref:Transcriptional regulator n=1 Tax=Zymobacter palmae TaxID=33074 RepID=A0A348HBV7_9GAMM|nr:transcriptional regulator [Zymobacter palmae]
MSLTTLPVSVRGFLSSAILVTCFLVDHSLDTSDVATRLLQQMGLTELTRSFLHTQVELLTQQLKQLRLELID